MTEKLQQETELYRQVRSCCIKLDKGFDKAGIGMEVGDDNIAASMVNNHAALKLSHPQRRLCSAPDATDIDCFSIFELFVHNALMSADNGSSAGLDGI